MGHISKKISSALTLKCLESLENLSNINRTNLTRVLGHSVISGNNKAVLDIESLMKVVQLCFDRTLKLIFF